MLQRSHCTWLLMLFTSAVTLADARSARADVKACIDQHSQGQLLRDESHFKAARDAFVGCADAACPAPIRSECASFQSAIEQSMPTVLLAARDEQGNDVIGVRVELDGQPLEGALTGRAIRVDPGPHRFRFVAPDGRSRELDAIVLESAKDRTIEALFAKPAVADAPAKSGIPTLAYVFGGIGVGAALGFGYFALSGKSERNNLAETCSPLCTGEQLSSVRSKYLVADVLLGVGAASLGAGAYFFFSAPEALPGPVLGRGLVIGVRSTL